MCRLTSALFGNSLDLSIWKFGSHTPMVDEVKNKYNYQNDATVDYSLPLLLPVHVNSVA